MVSKNKVNYKSECSNFCTVTNHITSKFHDLNGSMQHHLGNID